ncbi:MAG: SUMF1/EgtB/PvdO family nonheme iron enzyme [Planctomycetes bacterium]|nr:SUMF1/EgtB/PvdO family nonheme iron enzyme [Planctomycetota bacterium]
MRYINKIRETLLLIFLFSAVLAFNASADSTNKNLTKVTIDIKNKKYTETITDKNGKEISFDMVLIPSGSFQMGSNNKEENRADHEGPQFEVQLDSYYLCTTETTLELFKAYYEETVSNKKSTKVAGKQEVDGVSGATPVYGDMSMGYSEKNPAIGMTWKNAMQFCHWLSKKTGKGYCLPTEAQWEYACRAGSDSVYGVTNSIEELEKYAWFDNNSNDETHAVGKKIPNAWGLHDMLGNVNEWVYDFYDPEAYSKIDISKPIANPQGPIEGTVHVVRGGAYDGLEEEIRCASRNFEEDWWRFGDPQIPKSRWWLPEMDIVGFRIALNLPK